MIEKEERMLELLLGCSEYVWYIPMREHRAIPLNSFTIEGRLPDKAAYAYYLNGLYPITGHTYYEQWDDSIVGLSDELMYPTQFNFTKWDEGKTIYLFDDSIDPLAKVIVELGKLDKDDFLRLLAEINKSTEHEKRGTTTIRRNS